MQAILHHPQQRYASSRTPRKIVPSTAGSSINVPTAQAITQNVVVPSDPPQQVPTMPAQLQRDKDNSNPSTLWNLSRSLSFIRWPILQIKPGALTVEGWKFWLATHLDRIYQETILSIILRGAKLGYCGPRQKPKAATYHRQQTTHTSWQTWNTKLRQADC